MDFGIIRHKDVKRVPIIVAIIKHSPVVRLMPSMSRLPQNCELKTAEPETRPNKSRFSKKNIWLPSPTAVILSAPSRPIITASAIFTAELMKF